MGFMDRRLPKDNGGENLSEQLERFLVPKDGLKHIALIKTFTKNDGKNTLDVEYTLEINGAITVMQKMGYEILDISTSSFKAAGTAMNDGWINTLITYK